MKTLFLSDLAAEISDELDIDPIRALVLAEHTTYVEDSDEVFGY